MPPTTEKLLGITFLQEVLELKTACINIEVASYTNLLCFIFFSFVAQVKEEKKKSIYIGPAKFDDLPGCPCKYVLGEEQKKSLNIDF